MVFKRLLHPVVLLVVLTLLTHGLNLWHFPYFENDEGTYTSQAWWLVNFRTLSPYTYWYDHSPVGWAQIGLWQLLTGGPFSLGFSLYSTRTFMLLISVFSAILLYAIAKELTKKSSLAFLATVIFIFSPLSIYFHRRVLLDNLETFWLLVSLWLLLKAQSQLWFLALSGGLFGWAFLSKESAVFLLPAFAYAVWAFSRKENRWFGLLVWFITAAFVMATFPFMAIFKHEFFPTGWFGDTAPHVSFLEALSFQLGRGAGGVPLSAFWQALTNSWWVKDPLLVLLGAWVFLAGLAGSFFQKPIRAVFFLSLSYLVFLLKGGAVLDFYIIPLIPFLSLLFVLVVSWLGTRFTGPRALPGSLGLAFSLVLGALLIFPQAKNIFLVNETGSQVEAVKYVKKNISPEAFLAIDDFALTDLRLPTRDGPAFPFAHWFSKVEHDPAVKDGVLFGRWENINYLLLSHEITQLLNQGELPFLEKAYKNTKIVQDFLPGSGKYRDLSRGISTNGDWATLLAVQLPLAEQLSSTAFGGVLKDTEVDRKIKVVLSKIDLPEKIGQLFWVSLSGTTLTEGTKNFLNSFKPGGILLQGENIIDEKTLIGLTRDLSGQDDEPLRRPVIAVDQEGGTVSRIPFESQGFLSQAEIDNEIEAKKVAQTRGRQLRWWGIGVNLAPVADIPWDEHSTIARVRRGFVGDEKKVADLVAATVGGYRDAGVLPVVKHFPGGLGRTGEDPHVSLPKIELGAADLAQDLYPFRKAIESGVAGVMVSHLSYPQIDPKLPTSLSEIFVGGLLRQQLNFPGLVVIDDISMNSLTEHFSTEKILENAIKAGGDVIIMSGTAEELSGAKETLLKLVQEGKISEERLNQSLVRILRFKSEYQG